MTEYVSVRRNVSRPTSFRLSVCLSVLAAGCAASFVTWHFMVAAALDDRSPTMTAVLGWTFWMMVIAVGGIWACWVKTATGWRWRWERF